MGDFELTDQNAVTRNYRFPKAKVTAMIVADREGAEQLEPWIRKIYSRYEKRIDIDGVADVSMIPKPFRGMVSAAFRKRSRLFRNARLGWFHRQAIRLRERRGERLRYRPRRSNREAGDRPRQRRRRAGSVQGN